MAIDPNDEILQDFLIEAGEILEQMGEQLVALEDTPEDADLLNTIFRGFHTVKGGAGFLGITPLVDLCHRAEDVFNVLRQGERKVDPDLMDAVLKALDGVNAMLEGIRAGEEPAPADPDLLAALQRLVATDAADFPGGGEDGATSEGTYDPPGEENKVPTDSGGDQEEDPVEAEFEALLQGADGGEGDELSDANKPHQETVDDSASDQEEHITEEEFEKLLDVLHGPSGAPGKKSAAPTEAADTSEEAAGEHITDEEFDALLDQLHGPGQHRGVPIQPLASDGKDIAPSVSGKGEIQTQAKPALKAVSGDQGKPSADSRPSRVDSTVRVDTQRLDEIMNMVGELVLVRNRFKTLRSALDNEDIAKAVASLDVVTSDLQLAVMKTRMQPIKRVFGRFPRVVRDLARNLDKEVRLEMRGEETDLDKNLVEALADPLVHLVRNSVDHGIETPEEREQMGKAREGLVILSAAQQGDRIELTIEDDGKGMDPDVLRRKAVEKGLMDAETAARLDQRECCQLIFMPGFSTKSEISDISGRGVGMDVVKTRINQMNGTVEIDSVKGKGSKITIKVPLTLAIMPTLMVKLDNQPFALPLSSVVEIMDLDLKKTNVVDGQEVVIVRDRTLPLFYLKDWLIQGDRRLNEDESGHVVVVNVGGRYVGFVVDHLVGQEEVVIKALGAKLHGLHGLAGATITGDGMIALILDVPGLMQKYAA
ncbi:chemotaxis protein CheA [Methylohalobius crimeensis]|uniref:chemotaxis protein CheA n=1 Tax=Methylohalobius crimeensis TaxID=244365 RepID=UPI0003B58CB2|nr:chemotaxis protein CheA [Methylohalobius crimeensis]